MGIVAFEPEVSDWVILAMGIALRGILRDQGIEQISGWLAGMALTVITAPTNGQV